MTQFPNVTSQYGAPMGRFESYRRTLPESKLRIFRVRLDSGGYDDGGAYWGIGAPLYCVTDADQFRRFFRANDRAHAYRKLGRDIGGPYPLRRPIQAAAWH